MRYTFKSIRCICHNWNKLRHYCCSFTLVSSQLLGDLFFLCIFSLWSWEELLCLSIFRIRCFAKTVLNLLVHRCRSLIIRAAWEIRLIVDIYWLIVLACWILVFLYRPDSIRAICDHSRVWHLRYLYRIRSKRLHFLLLRWWWTPLILWHWWPIWVILMLFKRLNLGINRLGWRDCGCSFNFPNL